MALNTKNYLGRLAADLLSIQINVIVKEDLVCADDESIRHALYSLASEYRHKLVSYSITSFPPGRIQDREVFQFFENVYGGKESFQEIQAYAIRKTEEIDNTMAYIKNPDIQTRLREQQIMCERIRMYSNSIISIFKELEKEAQSEDEQQIPDPKTWNNEYPILEFKRLPELKLDPSQIALLQKALEIGTQQVLLQSVIKVSGDVTSYVTNRFLAYPEHVQKTLLSIQNESISTSIRMWQYLFNAIGGLITSVAEKVTKGRGKK
ncbi:MAG: hypothetical protein JJT94_02560 [Bernardetiaceae bacterium]|nr:hypothetical protein [Bernardetiaceae bacterium]